jgi:hypothetical protein
MQRLRRFAQLQILTDVSVHKSEAQQLQAAAPFVRSLRSFA